MTNTRDQESLQYQRDIFFTLSQELRDQIYSHFFQSHEEPITEPSQLNNLTKIFVLNKQIFSETHGLFYSKYYHELIFTFTSVEKILSMMRSIGRRHPEFTGRLQLHHIHEPLSFTDPASLSIYDNANAIWHINFHFGAGIWRPNSYDDEGFREKFRDNPVVVDTERFFGKGSAGDLDSVDAEVITGGGETQPVSSIFPVSSGRKSEPKWTVSVKYALLEDELSRCRYIGSAIEVVGNLGTSMRTLFTTPSLTKRRN
jgi:hypothetical protein